MTNKPDTQLSEPTHAERLQSALLFIKSLQEHICDPKHVKSAGSTDQASTEALTITTGPSAPAIIIDRRRSSIQESHMTSTRNYSPRCSICPYEWDGEPPVGKAMIYRLNPSPGQERKHLMVSEVEVEVDTLKNGQ